MLRFTLVPAGVIACVLGMFSVLRIGQARAFVNRSHTLATVTQAVKLSPHDPRVYSARAAILARRGEFRLAVDDLRQAIALRPRDYKLWAELGRVLAKEGDSNSALVALSEAQSLAPFALDVYWGKAMLLLELGRHEEAFKELRAATLTLPATLDSVIEKAWETYAGNCEAVQRAINPQTTEERLALARFFIRKDRAFEAMGPIRLIGVLSTDERRQLVRDFLQARRFTEAHEVWTAGRGNRPSGGTGATINDGGFERELLSDEVGFSWVVKSENSAVTVSVDKENAHTGMSSLRLNWRGTPNASNHVIAQLVLVEPNTRYELSFVARAQDLITGGAPVITIIDVSHADNKKLAQSSVLPLGNSGWQDSRIDFATTASTRAIRIALQRQSCNEQPCPIFGSLWLDDFRLVSH